MPVPEGMNYVSQGNQGQKKTGLLWLRGNCSSLLDMVKKKCATPEIVILTTTDI